jgi:hypothetical protein
MAEDQEWAVSCEGAHILPNTTPVAEFKKGTRSKLPSESVEFISFLPLHQLLVTMENAVL